MHPILFSLGPVTLYTYGLAMALAFLAAIGIIFKEAKRENIDTTKLSDLGFTLIISGIIGARILFVIVNLPEYLSKPMKIIMVWEGGLIFYGGILGALLAGIIFIKRHSLPFWQVVDILAPALILAQAIGRIGCFMAGCCYGHATSLPWGVKFTNPNTLAPMGIFIHPTQLYHFFANITIFFLLYYFLRKKRTFTGQIFCLYLCLYPIGRFLIEFFRGDSRTFLIGPINLTQVISIVIFLGGIYLYLWRKSDKKSSIQIG